MSNSHEEFLERAALLIRESRILISKCKVGAEAHQRFVARQRIFIEEVRRELQNIETPPHQFR